MKKLLFLLLLLPTLLKAQVPALQDTVISGASSPLTPTYRYQTTSFGVLTYRYNPVLGKYALEIDSKYLRAYYAPAVAGGYVPTTRQILNGYAILGGTQLNNDITKSVDSTKVQTILNFFPKADTRYYTKTQADARYAPIAGSGYKLNSDSTASTGYLSRLTAQKYVTYDSPLKSLNMGSFNITATNVTGSILNSGGGYWNNSVLNLGSGGGAAVVVDYAGTSSSGIRFYDSASGQFGFTFNRTPGSPILSFGAFPSYGYASIGPSGVTSLGNPVEVTTNKVTTLDNSTTHYPTTSAIATVLGSYQPALSGTGFVKISGSTISYDNSTYLTTSAAATGYIATTGTQTGLTGDKTTTGTWTFGSLVNNGTSQFTGNVGIGVAAGVSTLFNIQKNSTGAATMVGNSLQTTIQSDVTGAYTGYQSKISTAVASFNLPNLYDFAATGGTLGTGSTVGRHVAFFAMASLGASLEYGFRSDLTAATGAWGFFSSTANNSFGGLSKFGANTVPIYTVDVNGTLGVSGTSVFLGTIKAPQVISTTTGTGTAGTDSLVTHNPTTNQFQKISPNYYVKGTQLKLTASGNGTNTTISIAHGLTGVTSTSFVEGVAKSAAAGGFTYMTVDATNVNFIYTTAPVTGTNNLLYNVTITP